MLFVGGIQTNARLDLYERLTPIINEKFQILCSGKFTFEHILYNKGAKHIIGCDVSCLSMSIGAYLNKQNFNIEFMGEFSFLNEYIDGNIESKVATILYLYGASEFYFGKNLQNKMALKRYLNNKDKYIEKNKIQFIKEYECLKGNVEFFAKDCFEVLHNSSQDEIILSYMPTYTGGYEKLYKIIDMFCIYDKPNYMMIDKDRYIQINSEILATRKSFVFTDIELPNLNDRLVSHYKGIGKDVFLYSNINENKKFYTIKSKNPFIDINRLVEVDNLKPKSKIEVLKCNNYNAIRARFPSDKLKVLGSVDVSFVVLIDKRYAGAFAFVKQKNFKSFYLLSDFVFVNKRKLSKLIPMLARSKEVIEYVEMKLNMELNVPLITKVQTEAPISMKYRGIYELDKRVDDGLIYSTKAKERTLQEEYRLWLEKYYNKSK